jgi:hypothetical protein
MTEEGRHLVTGIAYTTPEGITPTTNVSDLPPGET